MPLALLFILNKTKELIVQERSDRFFDVRSKSTSSPYFQSGEVLKDPRSIQHPTTSKANRDIIVNLENAESTSPNINEFSGKALTTGWLPNGLVVCSVETIDQSVRSRILKKYFSPTQLHLLLLATLCSNAIFPKFRLHGLDLQQTDRIEEITPISKSEILGPPGLQRF